MADSMGRIILGFYNPAGQGLLQLRMPALGFFGAM